MRRPRRWDAGSSWRPWWRCLPAADVVAGVKPTKATLASLLPPGTTGDVVARLTRGEQIIVNDIDRHGRSVFRHGAAPSGAMVSMAAFPVWMQGRVVGTFVFC